MPAGEWESPFWVAYRGFCHLSMAPLGTLRTAIYVDVGLVDVCRALRESQPQCSGGRIFVFVTRSVMQGGDICFK